MPVDQWYQRRYMQQLRQRLETAMGEVGELAAHDAAQRAPRAEGAGHMSGGGHAADTITHVETSEPDAVTTRVGVGKKGWYLIFAERGTSQQAATPWLRPAIFGNRARIMRLLGGR